MYKFLRINVYDDRACRELEALLNSGWEIREMQSVQACEGVIESMFILYRAEKAE